MATDEDTKKMFEEAQQRLNTLCDDVSVSVQFDVPTGQLLLKHLMTQYLTFGGHLRMATEQMLQQKFGDGKLFSTPDDVTDGYLHKLAKLFDTLAQKAKLKRKPGQLPLPVEKLRFMILQAEYDRVKTLLTAGYGAKVFRFVPWKTDQEDVLAITEEIAETVTEDPGASGDIRPSEESSGAVDG
jgi:hypothetical protein